MQRTAIMTIAAEKNVFKDFFISPLYLQAIANFVYCLYLLFPMQFFSESLNMKVNRSAVAHKITAPYIFVKGFTEQSNIFITGKQKKKFKFLFTDISEKSINL